MNCLNFSLFFIRKWVLFQIKSSIEKSEIKIWNENKLKQEKKPIQGHVWHSERDWLFTQCLLSDNEHIMVQTGPSEKGYFVSNAIEWEGHAGQPCIYCSWNHVSFIWPAVRMFCFYSIVLFSPQVSSHLQDWRPGKEFAHLSACLCMQCHQVSCNIVFINRVKNKKKKERICASSD